MKNLILTFLIFIFLVGACKPDEKYNARYVWLDEPSEYTDSMARHQFVCFRYDFSTEVQPEEGIIHLYAASRYLLKVNGENVNWGPSRNYPEEPEYDTYDISALLKKGENVISVRVMSNGMNTYQLVKTIGSFIAWGNIKTKEKQIDLSTPGNWKCKQDKGYDQQAPKMTFAQGAMDIYDARKGLTDWDKLGIDLEDWKTPVVIKQQDYWGKLQARSIPHLTQDKVIPRNIRSAWSLKNEEDIYSFRITIPDATKNDFSKNPWVFAYTYIYSPTNQTVDVGMWWGEHFLNGKPLQGKAPAGEGIYRRTNYSLQLNKGWNYLFVKYGIVWAHWEFYMLVPKNKGILLSPDKSQKSETFAKSVGPFNPKEDSIIRTLVIPFYPEQLPALSKTWVAHKRGNYANNPAVEIAYSYFDSKKNFHPSKVRDIELDDPEGNALVFDMGKNTYGRVFIEYTAPQGTIIDVGLAEEESGERIDLLRRYGQYMAFRHIAKEGRNYFEMSRPNGHRLLHLNVKGATGKVVIHSIGTIKQNYPMQRIASFECSDRMLNSVWELGRRTIELCADDIYTDPFRERGLYAGDLLPETTLGYLISGDTKLIRKSMQQIQGLYAKQMHPNADSFMTREREEVDRHNIHILHDYPFITLINLWWYYQITGDKEFLKSSYPKYKYMMDQTLQQIDEKGIFTERHAFIEWIQMIRPAQLSTMQALISHSTSVLSNMALELGYKDDAELYKKAARESKDALNKYFWDNTRKAYFDGFKEGVKIDHFFPASSAWPVIFQAAEKDNYIHISNFMDVELDSIGNISRHDKTSPYGGFYVLGALYMMNNAATAEMFMRKYWTPMILEGDDTAWENFGKDGGQGSLSHGWSGGPTWYMSTCLLGVQLGYPEYTDLTKVTISPQSETIDWAKGIVPHPTGIVKVDWRVLGNNLFVNYEVENGVDVVVNPRGRLAKKTLWVNGKKQ